MTGRSSSGTKYRVMSSETVLSITKLATDSEILLLITKYRVIFYTHRPTFGILAARGAVQNKEVGASETQCRKVQSCSNYFARFTFCFKAAIRTEIQ